MHLYELTANDLELALLKTFGPNGEDDYDEDDDLEDYDTFYGWGSLDDDISELPEYTYRSGAVRPFRAARNEILGFRVAVVEDFGGGEGSGEIRYVVLSVTDGTDTRYFRKDGYYASYDGDTWDGDFREVTPVERVVTFYE